MRTTVRQLIEGILKGLARSADGEDARKARALLQKLTHGERAELAEDVIPFPERMPPLKNAVDFATVEESTETKGGD